MIRVANAPCSWGVLEFAAAPRAPAAQVLDEMRAAGYDGTELGDWGFLPTDARMLRRMLDARTLHLVGAFVPVALAASDAHAPGVETAVRTARLMRDAGASSAFIILADLNATVPAREQHAGRIAPDAGLTARQWTTFAAGAQRIAEAVRDRSGLRTVFHPHCGGWVETPHEIDELMSRTDAEVIGLVLDTGHVVYGGGDPLEVLRRYRERVRHVHFKDCDPEVASRARRDGVGYLDAVRAQLFCQLGAGGVDFSGVTSALRDMQYDGWIVVEQDVFPGYGTPLVSARRSREFLRGLGL